MGLRAESEAALTARHSDELSFGEMWSGLDRFQALTMNHLDIGRRVQHVGRPAATAGESLARMMETRSKSGEARDICRLPTA